MDYARCGCARHMAKLCRQGTRSLHLTLDVTKNFSFGENAIFVTPRCLNRLILAQPSTRSPVLVSRETFAPPQRAIPWGWKLPRYDPRGDHCTPVTDTGCGAVLACHWKNMGTRTSEVIGQWWRKCNVLISVKVMLSAFSTSAPYSSSISALRPHQKISVSFAYRIAYWSTGTAKTFENANLVLLLGNMFLGYLHTLNGQSSCRWGQ